MKKLLLLAIAILSISCIDAEEKLSEKIQFPQAHPVDFHVMVRVQCARCGNWFDYQRHMVCPYCPKMG